MSRTDIVLPTEEDRLTNTTRMEFETRAIQMRMTSVIRYNIFVSPSRAH